jgi:hypothetical protein
VNAIDSQLEALRSKYTVEFTSVGGVSWVVINDVELPAGWNQPKTTILIKIPPGYPVAAPDCFWADASLRLGSGAMPRSAQINTEFGGQQRLWFSFHVQKWNPNIDDLWRYLSVVRNRLEQVV